MQPSREVGGRRRHKEISRDDFPRFLTSVFNGLKTGINSALRREGNDTNSEIQGQFKGFGMESNCVWLFLSVTDVTKTYDGGRPKSASPSVIPNLGSHVNSLSSISTSLFGGVGSNPTAATKSRRDDDSVSLGW